MSASSRLAWILAVAAAVFLLAVAVVKVFFVGYYQIPQDGMYPGLPKGSHLISRKNPYPHAESVQRGDVILFVREQNGQRYNFIWRVIGLPGDHVEASGESLQLNGKPVAREKLREADGKVIYREHLGDVSYEVAFDTTPKNPPPDASVTVSAKEFFVMGDNRFNALDSRYFGPIPFDSIIGRKW